jgi:hypothetical protein
MTRLPIMTELGRGMGWHAGTVLAMLWMYLDESGDHDRRTGNLIRLALAGGIARFDAWEALSIEWAETLIRFEIPMFHMTDFEARRGPFEGWDNDRRKALMRQLMDIALTYVPVFWGVIGESTQSTAGKKHIRRHYMSNVSKTVKELWFDFESSSEPLTVVFAAHRDIRAEEIGRFFDLWKVDAPIEFGGFAKPETLCPLQLADIVAYEFRCAARPEQPEKMRYPLTRLKTAKRCVLTFAETLGEVQL